MLAFVSLLPEIYLWRLLRSTAARLVTGRCFRFRCGVFLLLVLMWTGCMGALNPELLVVGATVTFGWIAGIARPLRHLPTYWLPPSVTASKIPAVMPPVFTFYAPAVAGMAFGLAAMPSLFI
jgi:hypothetical protein